MVIYIAASDTFQYCFVQTMGQFKRTQAVPVKYSPSQALLEKLLSNFQVYVTNSIDGYLFFAVLKMFRDGTDMKTYFMALCDAKPQGMQT